MAPGANSCSFLIPSATVCMELYIFLPQFLVFEALGERMDCSSSRANLSSYCLSHMRGEIVECFRSWFVVVVFVLVFFFFLMASEFPLQCGNYKDKFSGSNY